MKIISNLIIKLLQTFRKINNLILLTFIWVFVLFPISLLKRLFSKEFQKFSWNQKLNTNWQDKNHLYNKGDLKNEW
ncbi:MAG: hypothetical protein COB02_06405 [Candidatus Cloacimonadota bacterium]|nr:MAG: hypothetical protein COB02_06405 [Candidatus Cloacimonadota bacterium]